MFLFACKQLIRFAEQIYILKQGFNSSGEWLVYGNKQLGEMTG
jgi:hypothetical protein